MYCSSTRASLVNVSFKIAIFARHPQNPRRMKMFLSKFIQKFKGPITLKLELTGRRRRKEIDMTSSL